MAVPVAYGPSGSDPAVAGGESPAVRIPPLRAIFPWGFFCSGIFRWGIFRGGRAGRAAPPPPSAPLAAVPEHTVFRVFGPELVFPNMGMAIWIGFGSGFRGVFAGRFAVGLQA